MPDSGRDVGREADALTLDRLRAAATLLDGVATRTPVETSRVLSSAAGVEVLLKCENLQRAGSFKIRGAYVRMAGLTGKERASGVVAASAGNHAQGVALAAELLGLRATIVMPVDAALPKVAATRDYGAEVVLAGTSVDEALAVAREHAARTGSVLIHPFDHVDVVAGQATVGLEILEQVPGVRTIVVPLGGGGLAAGVAAAVRATGADVRVIGVQAAAVAPYPASVLAGHPVAASAGVTAGRGTGRGTMADGIAVHLPGALPLEVVRRSGVEVRTVSEEDLSRALLLVAERAKLVVEPAGAAAVAALVASGAAGGEPVEGPAVAVLSGGNIDPLVMLRVFRHGLVAAGRYLQLRVRVTDAPGVLAALLAEVAATGGNVVHVAHVRTGADLAIDEVGIDLQVETKGPGHRADVVEHLRRLGYGLQET